MSCNNTNTLNPSFFRHPNDNSKKVEIYIKKPIREKLNPDFIFIHGHQDSNNVGARDFVNLGVLDRYSNQGFAAAAITQPGYWQSDGSPDYSDPIIQNVVIAKIQKLKNKEIIDLECVITEGIGRGAIVAGLIVAKE
jgi:pimeloyl-ACP methyl ester carboxylesterase